MLDTFSPPSRPAALLRSTPDPRRFTLPPFVPAFLYLPLFVFPLCFLRAPLQTLG